MRTVTVMLLLLTACAAPGRTVVLRPDGTWTYADEPAARPSGEVLQVYTKPVSASVAAKGERVPYELWFDSAKWRRNEGSVLAEPDSDQEFYHHGRDARARVIAERYNMTLDTAVGNVVAGSRRTAKDLKVIRQDRRSVNGAPMVYLHLEGTWSGIEAVVLTQIYAGRRGVVQVIAYTSRIAFWDYAKDMEELLNGLVPVE